MVIHVGLLTRCGWCAGRSRVRSSSAHPLPNAQRQRWRVGVLISLDPGPSAPRSDANLSRSMRPCPTETWSAAACPLLVGPHVLVDGLTRVPGAKTHPVRPTGRARAHVVPPSRDRCHASPTPAPSPGASPQHRPKRPSATRRRHRNRTRRGQDGRNSQPLRYREPRRRYEPDGPCDPELPCSEFPGVPAAFAACLAACASAFALRCARELVSPGLFGLILSSAS